MEPVPATTYPTEYPQAPTHPHMYTPPNVLRLGSGVYHPTTSIYEGVPFPMPSFLAKKYQASRSVSSTGTGSSYNHVSTQTANNSFDSRSSEEVVTDVQVVSNEPVYSYRGNDDDAFGEPRQYHGHHYEDRRPAYRPRRQPATQQSWYYPSASPAPVSEADAISEWQQQLQIKQQRAPRTADFGFGTKPEEERNRALAQNRQLPPAELKRLRKFYNNRNEHSHPTSMSHT